MVNEVAASVATPPIAPHLEATLSDSDQLVVRGADQDRDQRRVVALVASGVAAVALILFVALARVPIAAGWRQDRALRVRDIWNLFTLELAALVGSWLSPVLITVVVIAILGGCVVALGLAFMAKDEPPDVRDD